MRFRRAPAARGAAALLALLLTSGCAGVSHYSHDGGAAPGAAASPDSSGHTAAPAPRGVAIADLAVDMVGVPYRYGGADPREGFDCSGLVFYAYSQAGLEVPRNSQALFKATKKIPLELAAQGDLVFFQDQQKLSHVGIYLGDDLFVHAPSSGRTVSVSSLESAYYRRHLVGVGRLLPD